MSERDVQAGDLARQARNLRRRIFRMIVRAGGGHVAPSFSLVEILTVLYFHVLRIDPERPWDPDRDRFVLSKGHGCAALYAVLVEAGFAGEEVLDGFCRPGGVLGGHPDRGAIPGIEATTGALGHGFPFAVGLALAGRRRRTDFRVVTVVGDGECQEGTVWEAALFAAQHRLDNLTVVVDANGLQAMGPVAEIDGLEPLPAKAEAFGWAAREVDGHDIPALMETFAALPFRRGRPNFIVARTVKGKGLSFMENVPIWHYRLPDGGEMRAALHELGLREEDL